MTWIGCSWTGAERMSRVSSTPIRAIVAAEVVSSIGSSMTVLALPWFVLVTTGSATKLGLVLGIGSIPFVTLPLPAGSLIARIGARQTMVIADAARLPLLAAIPALYSLDALSFPLLVVLVALTNVCLAAHMPAQRLILAEVVGDEESLVALCISTLTMEAFFTLFTTTLPVFAYSDYDQNARIAGVFYAAMGAGALLGMPLVPVVVRRFGALHVAGAAFVLASIPKLLLGIPLPAAGVAAVLVLQGVFGSLTGAPIFAVITTRTPSALRTKVLSAALGLMFLTGPLGQIATGPLINAVGARTV